MDQATTNSDGTSTILSAAWRRIVVMALLASVLITPILLHVLPSVAQAQSRQSPHGTPPDTVPAVTPLASATESAGNGQGDMRFFTFQSKEITDRQNLKMNVASGDVLLEATDMHLRGTMLDLVLSRTYNSQMTSAAELGRGWMLNVDQHLTPNADSSVTYTAPSGYAANFTPNGSSYNIPAGVDDTLVHNGDGTFTLTAHQSQEKWTFNASGKLTADASKHGKSIAFTYDGSGHLTTITDTQGRKTTLAYTAGGLLQSIADPSSRTVRYGYTNGLLSTATDFDDKTTTYGYSSVGDLTSVTDPMSHATTMTYNDDHAILTLKDANGHATTWSYGGPVNGASSSEITDANGHGTGYGFGNDPNGNPFSITSTTDDQGNRKNFGYAPDANVATYTDALNNVSNLTYDQNFNVRTIKSPTGGTTTYGYTDTSNPYQPTSTQDAQGNTTTYAYTNSDLTTTKNATQNQASASYNSDGTVASRIDFASNAIGYSYTNGNLTRITAPFPLGATALAYDSLSRVISITDGKGEKTSYSYDTMDRVATVTYANGAKVSYTYDADGNVKTEADSTGTTTFSYDDTNEQTAKSLPGGSQTAYDYDKVGNLTDLTDAGGHVSYAYNTINLVTTTTDPDGAQTTFGYDPKSERRNNVTYPNHVSVTLGYDNSGRQTSIVAKNSGGTVLDSFAYTYVKGANDTDLRQTIKDAQGDTTTLSYDALNELTQSVSTNAGGSQIGKDTYTYDANGNRTSWTNGFARNQAYNGANELLSDYFGSDSFDANGNMTAGHTSTNSVAMGYNAAGQTTSFTSGSNSATQAYTGTDQTERVQAGSTSFSYNVLGLATQKDTSGLTAFTRDNRGVLLGERTTAGKFYYLFDGLGSVVGITDASGKLVNNYKYDPYGRSIAGNGGSAPNPFGFAGGYLDANTGLYKFGARYYDPETANWTQQDPIGGNLANPQTLNPYAYVQSDPANKADPTGRVSQSCGLAAIGIALDGVAVAASATGVGAPLAGGALFGASLLVGAAQLPSDPFTTSVVAGDTALGAIGLAGSVPGLDIFASVGALATDIGAFGASGCFSQ